MKINKNEKPPKQKRQRKLKYTWNSPAEISALISAIQKRPPLWDGGCSEYKLPNAKIECWQQVVDELGIAEVDAIEARNKWNIIRSLFKSNVKKLRSKKTGQISSKYAKWAHFSEMMFLESAADVSQSAQTKIESPASTPTKELESSYIDASIFRDLSQQSTSTAIPTTVDDSAGPRRKRRKARAPTPTSSSMSSHSGSVKDLAAEVLCNLSARANSHSDRYQAFGDLVAGHLRSLPASESLLLERSLMNNIYDFLGSRVTYDPLK